ncbi:MAG: 50S ribosomal protein L11 methyltransferase [Cyanobacteria bacterium J06554_11]
MLSTGHPQTDNRWWEVTVTCLPELEDIVYWHFEQLGGKGTVSQRHGETRLVSAYLLEAQFQPSDFESFQSQLANNALESGLPAPFQVTWQLIDEEDWAKSWKVHWKPEEVGDRLLINPAWMAPPETLRTVLTLDPGSAFGTGTHATTQLCLKALEQQPADGLTLADIGCGSGILSIAALLYGAQQVYAADVDPLATKATRDNANLNGIVPEQLKISLGSVGDIIAIAEGPVDGIVCNILAEIIVAMILPRLGELARPSTWCILSGILTSKADWVEEHLIAHGWQVNSQIHQDEWCAMTVTLAPAA